MLDRRGASTALWLSVESSHQQNLWSGEFGTDYISRNTDNALHYSNVNFFSNVLAAMRTPPESVLELGANVGMNYLALAACLGDFAYTGVEINPDAHRALSKLPIEAIQSPVESFETHQTWDLVLTKGLLIHLNPTVLQDIYMKMARFSARYVLIAEYFSPSPIGVSYRGQEDALFKRDFAGEMMDLVEQFELVDYKFVYSREKFPQDDITWFLLEKST